MSLRERLDAARAEVSRLEREAETATCREIGHKWVSLGGANCGCPDGACSIPVNTCERCEDSDYGDNAEAAEVRAECRRRRE